MKLFKSKSFTAMFVLARAWPGLCLFALAFIWPTPRLYAYAAVTLTVCSLWILWSARSLPLILTASLLFTPVRAAEPKSAAGVCAIAVVVIIGGYCYYKMVKACQKLKPRVIPDDDEGTNATKSASETFIAINQDLPPSYCCAGQEKDAHEPTMVELDVTEVLSIRSVPEAQTVSAETFDQWLIARGFNPNIAGAQYTSASPVTFMEGRVVISGESPRRIILQRSEDLQSWQDLADITVPANLRLRVTDASERSGTQFYRLAK